MEHDHVVERRPHPSRPGQTPYAAGNTGKNSELVNVTVSNGGGGGGGELIVNGGFEGSPPPRGHAPETRTGRTAATRTRAPATRSTVPTAPLVALGGLALGALSACTDDDDKGGGGKDDARAARCWPRPRRPSTPPAASRSADHRGPARRRHRHHPAEGHRRAPVGVRGHVQADLNGCRPSAEVIAVDGKTYAKNSLLLPDWTEIEPADYGAPDPATLMDPDGGFSGLLASTEDVEDGRVGPRRRGQQGDPHRVHRDHLSDAVAALIPTAEGDFIVHLHDQRRRRAARGGPEGRLLRRGRGRRDLHARLDDYGTEKEITAP